MPTTKNRPARATKKPKGNTTPKRDNERAARALVDATLFGDRKACELHEITDRTLRNYRAALADDPDLSEKYALLSVQVSRLSWADQIDVTLGGATAKLLQLIEAATSSSPETIQAVTGAVKDLAEIAMTRDMLAARLRESDPDQPPAGTAPQPRAVN